MALCQYCSSLSAWLVPRFYDLWESHVGETPQKLEKYWWHQPSWSALRISARSCKLCALISEESWRAKPLEQDYLKLLLGGDPPSPAVRVQAFPSRLDILCHSARKLVRLNVALDYGIDFNLLLTRYD